MKLKPRVLLFLQVLLLIISLACVAYLALDYAKLKTTVYEISKRPVLIQRVVEKVTPIPTVSITPTQAVKKASGSAK